MCFATRFLTPIFTFYFVLFINDYKFQILLLFIKKEFYFYFHRKIK